MKTKGKQNKSFCELELPEDQNVVQKVEREVVI